MSLTDTVSNLVKIYCDKWWNISRELPDNLGRNYSYLEKLKNENEANKFIKLFISEIETFPQSIDERPIWKNRLKKLLHIFLSKFDITKDYELNFLFSKGIPEVTEQFIDYAKLFDTTFPIEDIGQALRNVWIMNVIQILEGKPVEFTPSIFGYSMLYPYTDNFLDDIHMYVEEKQEYCARFEARLMGEQISPVNSLEAKIFKLVSAIEGQYERAKYRNVYESLIGIHRAQTKSLKQQDTKCSPYDKNILSLSFEKGGISVLADGYLVSGKLAPDEEEFFFAYGILLQLCDDLQDVELDIQNGHSTIFSQTAYKWPLDRIANALLNLIYHVLDLRVNFPSSDIKQTKEIIRKNCLLLALFAISKNRKYFSKGYIRSVDKLIPFRQSFLKNFNRKIKKRYSRLKKEYHKVPVENLILYALK